MLLEELGKGVEVHEMDQQLIVKAMHILQHWEERGSFHG
jgi:hypothetical protein